MVMFSGANKLPFDMIVHGNYGRKVAYLNVDSINYDNLAYCIKECIKVIEENAAAIDYLWQYYKGNQPVLYRHKIVRNDIISKIVENHAYEIVSFKVAQTFGEPVQFVSLKDDESVNKAVDELNGYNRDAFKQARDIEMGAWQSSVGTAYKAIQFAFDGNGDYKPVPYRFVIPNPITVTIGYNASSHEPMLAIQKVRDINGNTFYKVFTETHECTYKDDEIRDYKLHAYGGIPIVEYPNNAERISDIELVITILDAINETQANRIDGIGQFVQSWIKFINCEVDRDSFEAMKQEGAIMVKSNNGDNKASVDIMTQELNQTQTQVAKDDLWDSALSILAIPSRDTESTGGDRAGATYLKNGWDFSKSRCTIKDAFVKEAEKRLGEIEINIIKMSGDKNVNLEWRDYDVNINHSPTDNMVVKAQSLQYLKECGIHPLVAIKTIGMWGDAEKVFMLSKPYIDRAWTKLESDGINIDEQTKKVELFMKFCNSGFSFNEAAEKSGLTIEQGTDGFARWNFEDADVESGE